MDAKVSISERVVPQKRMGVAFTNATDIGSYRTFAESDFFGVKRDDSVVSSSVPRRDVFG